MRLKLHCDLQVSQMSGQLPGQQGLGTEKAASNASSLPGLSQHSAQRGSDMPDGPSGPMSVPSATRQSSQVPPQPPPPPLLGAGPLFRASMHVLHSV